MPKKLYWAGAAALLAVAALGAFAWYGGGTQPKPSADANDAALVARGAAVYAEHCASCHGANLEGQADWRVPLAEGGLPAPPHDATGHTWHHADRLLFQITKQGGASVVPGGFQSNMPAFTETLGDDDIWAALAFIKSRWPANIRERQAAINQQSR